MRKTILNIFFPKTCPVCGEVLGKNEEICETCRKKLLYVQEPKCKKCGKPFDGRDEDAQYREYCRDCMKGKHIYDTGMAVFQYNEEIKESIYRFKYHNQRTYADFYGKAMAEKYGEAIKEMGIEVLIPVPISEKKRVKRGYNQAELIADVLGECLSIPVQKEKLMRIRDTVPQKELSYEERRNNLKSAFKIRKNIVEYKKVLVVDDIYTTGSTIDACAKALKEAGAKQVCFISLAIGAGI
ncbi:MAG: ComF family protein [Lachnospiraceae bacterium]|nr:ComF family protein [Lachnospiraceae bacterium]